MALPQGKENGKSTLAMKVRRWLHLSPKTAEVKEPKASYIALFRPIDDLQSRFILFCAIVFAIAAGAPLPIIGVIFSKIINTFPPSEEEIKSRISELVAVGKFPTLPYVLKANICF